LRIFLSFHSKDQALAEALREGLLRLESAAYIYLSSISLRAGFWLPKLAEEIAATLSRAQQDGGVGTPRW
jgi:hypothetical protein